MYTKIVITLTKKLRNYLNMMVDIFKNEQKLVDYMIDLIEKMQLQKKKINYFFFFIFFNAQNKAKHNL